MIQTSLTTYLRTLALFLFFLAILTYYRRFPTGDDAWFAEQSYWLWHEGKVRSEFFRGLLGWENQYLVSHKLFIAVGAILTGLFPESLYAVKLSGLLFFILLILLMTKIIYHQYSSSPNRSFIIPLMYVLLFSNALMVQMSFENRPEMMITSFGFGSFYFIHRNSSNKNFAFFSGFFAGLSLLSHLNGIIFIIAGGITYLYKKKCTNLVLFCLSAFLTSSLYFYDIISTSNGVETWWFQFSHDPATQNALGLWSKLKVVIEFPKLFVESPEQQAITFLFITTNIWLKKNWHSLNSITSIYLISLILSFWLITKRASGIYEIMFIPFLIIYILELLNTSSTNMKVPLYVKIVSFFYITVGFVGSVQTIHKNYSDYLPDKYRALRLVLPSKGKGLVPITFYFNEYKYFNSLLSHTNFDLQKSNLLKNKEASANDFFQWARNNKVHFILIDYQSESASFYPIKGIKTVKEYHLSFFDGRFAIYSI